MASATAGEEWCVVEKSLSSRIIHITDSELAEADHEEREVKARLSRVLDKGGKEVEYLVWGVERLSRQSGLLRERRRMLEAAPSFTEQEERNIEAAEEARRRAVRAIKACEVTVGTLVAKKRSIFTTKKEDAENSAQFAVLMAALRDHSAAEGAALEEGNGEIAAAIHRASQPPPMKTQVKERGNKFVNSAKSVVATHGPRLAETASQCFAASFGAAFGGHTGKRLGESLFGPLRGW
eukprot:Sspe_Gene.36016::Locus_17435_Transcript_2_3_Confidence_0.400_Length_1004::g.36016::m.36016